MTDSKTMNDNLATWKQTHIPWASIEAVYNIRKSIKAVVDYERDEKGIVHDDFVVSYKSKVKLDGTNSSVRVFPDGTVVAQSRGRIITPGDDNYGFAKWVKENEEYFANMAFLPEIFGEFHEGFTIFGEWCGQGIQKRTSISKIDRKVFAIFAIQYGDHHIGEERGRWTWIDLDPARIQDILGDVVNPDVFVLPWHGAEVSIDYLDLESLETAAEYLNKVVEDVEQCDPWVRDTFGIEGLGEGIVMYPVTTEIGSDSHIPPQRRKNVTSHMFKAKGEKHTVVRQKAPVVIDAAVAESIQDFAEMFVTPARCEQALEQNGLQDTELTMKDISGFMKWIGSDIKKESVAELEASNLNWKLVGKTISRKAKAWYVARMNESKVA